VEIEPEKLLTAINEGHSLSKLETSELVKRLNAVGPEEFEQLPSVDDLYSYIVVLSKLQKPEHQQVLERYLDVSDPLTVSYVLETFCLQWELTGDYLERVLRFAKGVSWDEEQDLQLSAIGILGEYCRDLSLEPTEVSLSGQLKKQLFAIFDQQEGPNWLRQAAYRALARACGRTWQSLPNECALLDFSPGSEDIDWQMLAQCRDQCRALAGSGSAESPVSSEEASSGDSLSGIR